MHPTPLLALLALAACAAPSGDRAHGPVDALFADYSAFKLRANPLEATALGEPGYDDQLANFISAEHAAELKAGYARFLDRIAAVDEAALSDADRLSLEVMRWDCSMKRAGLELPLAVVPSPMFDLPCIRLLPVNQIFSFHLFLGQLASGASLQPFETVEDYEHWLARVDQYVGWIDTAIENMRAGMRQGVVWPRVIVERMIAQLDGMLGVPLEEHVYWQPVRDMPETIGAAERERLARAYERMITDEVDPAHARLRAFLADDYLPRAGEHTGIGSLPGGPETYRHLIRFHTTTDMTADEIHALGEREVARIEGEMDAIRREVGFEGDLRAFFEHVRTSPAQMPYTEPAQVLEHFEAIHARMRPFLPELFDVQPKAGFEVRRTEAFREASASAEYVAGTRDGTRPGVFYVPIPDVRAYNRFADEALFLHEAIPGHHYQVSLQQENDALPPFRHAEGVGAYVEGWALYCESLGTELGLYTDPYQRFGMLSMEMHRAIRLVVDTGMHANGWTREQAIRYSLDHEAESEAGITAEIERYMIAPGQALAYKVGQLQIRELRERAAAALGARFDVREFHRQVLESGSLPLVLLERKIDGWIEEEEG